MVASWGGVRYMGAGSYIYSSAHAMTYHAASLCMRIAIPFYYLGFGERDKNGTAWGNWRRHCVWEVPRANRSARWAWTIPGVGWPKSPPPLRVAADGRRRGWRVQAD